MIYVCVTAGNHAASIGLLLWKVRRVFSVFPREYQLLVVDDGSSDGTAEVLERYQRALPVAVMRHERPRGFAAALQTVLGEALARTDRPRRDAALLFPPDFSVSPDAIPELVRRLESGADLVVGEQSADRGSLPHRAVRRLAPWLLRPGIRVPEVRDLLSGCVGVRLATVKAAWRDRGADGRLLDTDGLGARAELVARAASVARRVAAVPLPPPLADASAGRDGALRLAIQLFRTGRAVRVARAHAPADRADLPTQAPARPAS